VTTRLSSECDLCVAQVANGPAVFDPSISTPLVCQLHTTQVHPDVNKILGGFGGLVCQELDHPR
jgi:hypothetical protein